MGKHEKWICTAIGAFIGTVIVSAITFDFSYFVIRWFVSIISTRCIVYFLYEVLNINKKHDYEQLQENPFIVSEYYDRIEKESLKILEEYKPVDQTIVLWWGFDGLRLNEDGSFEWISRKKPEPKPTTGNLFFNSAHAMAQASGPVYGISDMCQSTQATINALQSQITQQSVNAYAISQLSQYQPGYLRQYAPNFWDVHFTGVQNCCCNGIIK